MKSRTVIMALALAWSSLSSTPFAAEQPLVIPAPTIGGGKLPDPYLWHVRGLPQGVELPVYSGAGTRFRVIHMLPEGTPIDRLNCQESNAGYWCRVATIGRPRISGWVDGRFLLEERGFAPPQDQRSPQPVIIIDPFAQPRQP